jgi:SSS family solute:Na+ symporter
MGTVAGALNSVSTLVSYDLVKRWRTDTSERTLVKVGRITAFFTIVLAIVWSLQLQRYESIFAGICALISYVAPPITAVFVWGIFWKRASSLAATVTLAGGSLLGFIVFVLDWNKEATGWNVPFLMAAFYLFAICSIILFVVSLIRPHRHTEESKRLVWAHPFDAVRSPGWPGLGDYRVIAAVLFGTMVLLYWIFR